MTIDAQSKARAITDEEFTTLMAKHGLAKDQKAVAIAVSGGADSMALSLLVARWGKGIYLSFDHGLRENSAQELETVGKWLKAKGLKHVILSWAGDKPTTGIQQAARDARYLAMETWCKENAVSHLLIAHHEDDQAETFIMRLARGSGVDGLTAMSAISPPLFLNQGPQYVRPLLGHGKDRLVATLEYMGQNWIEDPSNQNLAFTRIQARQLLKASPIEGLNNKRMANTATRMKRVRLVLDRLTSEAIDQAVIIDETAQKAGFCYLNIEVLKAADEEIALRVISRLLTCFGGNKYPPRLLPVERLFGEFMREGFSGATLAGCHILAHKDEKHQVIIGREANAISQEITVNPDTTELWDSRFLVHLDGNLPPLKVKKLEADKWRAIVKDDPSLAQPNLPNQFITTLPAFYLATSSGIDEIVAVPALGFYQSQLQGLTAEFQPKQGFKP
jgi:tRNA(Ile)-lysidine synthase